MEPAEPVNRRTAHRGRCALRRVGRCQRKTGVVCPPTEGASGTPPPTVVARCRFQRSREVQFSTPVTFHAASSVMLLYVGCTVLGAPRPRDRWVALDAVVRPDRFYPRFPRRVRLRPPPNVCNPAGTARAPLVRRREPRPPCHSRSVRYAPAVGGGVLDAPRSRDRRAALDAHVRRDRPHPWHPRCVNRALTDQRFIFRGHSPRTICTGEPR